ncbi:MAG: hypothetical protein CME65_02345 [Halobacteriovoraceae bacterium]|nr:hypothetical protein [Halobacteriovoraceae bacterium]|tara:strand:- start:18071 stop:19156 length:1086 start_codon:yes stop_codon:yes gene_type:complete
MNLSSNITVYLKTTETCNLNCSHCFTSGSKGAKIIFSPQKTIHFFERLKNAFPHIESIRYLFHGGEPFLAPLDTLYQAYFGLKDLFPKTSFGMQTNLVYPLSNEKRAFLKEVLYNYGFGTSWDYDIRFGSLLNKAKDSQQAIWEKNVRTLTQEDDHYMTMIVSITKGLIENKQPIEILRYAHKLGFKHILFERITSDGNAIENHEIIPSNRSQDEWLYKMFEQTMKYKTYEYIGNMFISELAQAYVNRSHVGNRCRNCEESLLTINADGSIAGCPNTAPVDHWGHIDWPLTKSFQSSNRLKTISCERYDRNPLCFSCPAFELCNSDCHKLKWDENESYCAAPKKIWSHMLKNSENYSELII